MGSLAEDHLELQEMNQSLEAKLEDRNLTIQHLQQEISDTRQEMSQTMSEARRQVSEAQRQVSEA